MKSLSQLKKLSAEQLVAEFVGSSFPFDFAECSSCLLQHVSGCVNPDHDALSALVRYWMKSSHGDPEYFGDRIKKNLTRLYKLRVKFASFFPTPVPVKFPKPKKKKKVGWKLKEAAPTIHSIYKEDKWKGISKGRRMPMSGAGRSAQLGIFR
jgi:hypothetical protein